MDRIKIPGYDSDSSKANKPESGKKQDHKRELFSTLAILIIAPIIALLLTSFVFQSYQVDGPSMEDTLHDQDRLIVTKVSKTWSRITGDNYIPERYSIVVFSHNSQDNYEVEGRQLIKRVIGLPGERVVIKNGVVTVYSDERPEGFYPDKDGPPGPPVISVTKGNVDTSLDEDEIFVLGDNRSNSLDSREFGPIESEDIIGNLAVRIYPFNSIEKF